MDFDWTASQQDLFAKIVQFATAKLTSTTRQRDAEHCFGRREWELCGEFGLPSLCIPERFGGTGCDCLTTAGAMEAFGRGCDDMGLVFSVSAHLFACSVPIAEFGSDELRQTLLPRLCSGALIGANAISEAEAGSDVFSMRSTAVREADSYRVSGTKNFVTNGPVADVFVVYAVSNPELGFMGISAFVVDRRTTGVKVGAPLRKIGLTTSPMSALYLDDVVVPASHRLGEEGQGGLVFQASMAWERACLFAGYLGQMERHLETVVSYARERQQFGKPIGKFQAVANRIVDMKVRLEAARLLLYRACWARDQGRATEFEVAAAKLAVSEAAIRNGLDAVQILGGYGTIADYDVERALRDAVPSTIFSGTSEMQRNTIAHALGL